MNIANELVLITINKISPLSNIGTFGFYQSVHVYHDFKNSQTFFWMLNFNHLTFNSCAFQSFELHDDIYAEQGKNVHHF